MLSERRQDCAVLSGGCRNLRSPLHAEFTMSQAVAVRTTSATTAPLSDGAAKTSTDLDTYLGARLQTMSSLPLGDPNRNKLRDEVICACLPVVRRLAARFFGRGENPEDLIQVATIGLIKSVDRYDAARETQFLSYATPTIL
ncbi:MAG TPA: sigma factor, partial [Micromonosporaceae bacterium]